MVVTVLSRRGSASEVIVLKQWCSGIVKWK